MYKIYNKAEQDSIKEINSLPAEERCYCGNFKKGECIKCNKDITKRNKSLDDRVRDAIGFGIY